MEGIWGFVKGLAEKMVAFVTDPRTVLVVFIFLAFLFLVSLLTVISKWRLYNKAGFPGWACLVPFYNDYVLVRVAGFSGWYFPITLVPSLDPYSFFVLQVLVARAFGKSILFGVGLYALPVVFYPILWLSGAEYQHPKLSLIERPKKMLLGMINKIKSQKQIERRD
uniref:Signal peptidase I n=1 Tax=candidate division WWE3 bacterium TaxID=2053526 RepID=A0A7C4XTI7_UNCKA